MIFFQETFGIVTTDTSFNNGVLTCTFKRKISATLAGDANLANKFFDLTESYFLLVAHGTVNSGGELSAVIVQMVCLFYKCTGSLN